MGYTAVTFVNEIPANAKIVVKGAFFINAKLSNAGGHEEGEREGNHKEGEEKDHKEDKTAKNFEKVEVLKGSFCSICRFSVPHSLPASLLFRSLSVSEEERLSLPAPVLPCCVFLCLSSPPGCPALSVFRAVSATDAFFSNRSLLRPEAVRKDFPAERYVSRFCFCWLRASDNSRRFFFRSALS